MIPRLLLTVGLLIASDCASAVELAAGIAGVEEGDDRLRPAGTLHLGITNSFFARAYVYGRSFGPITERTTMVSGNYRFPIFSPSSNFLAGIGAVVLLEETMVEAEADSGDADIDQKQYNFGGAFGLAYRLPFDHLHVSINWDAHLFLAGGAAVYMVTGRRQALSIATGVNL